MTPQFVHWLYNKMHSLDHRPIFQTPAHSDIWPKCTDCQVHMMPQVIQWNCAACLQIVTAELDTIAKQMVADELMAKGKGFKGFKGKGFKGFKCFRATPGGYDNATMCTQCLDRIEQPLVSN